MEPTCQDLFTILDQFTIVRFIGPVFLNCNALKFVLKSSFFISIISERLFQWVWKGNLMVSRLIIMK
jgi:hypothetical protein